MNSEILLIGESFSPWTKKARWALEHCDVPYRYKEYTPTLSEPGLRWKLKQWTGTVSVPVLFADQQVLRGSWDIACYANESVVDRRLGNMTSMLQWNEKSEAALSEGRTRVVRCIQSDDRALIESLPAFIPKPLRPAMKFVARDAVKRLDRKYAHLVEPGALRQALTSTRKALSQSENDYLSGTFSYADIAMAVVVEVIAPIARVQPPLGPVTEQCWHDSSLSVEFADLLDWRDRLAANTTSSYSQFMQ